MALPTDPNVVQAARDAAATARASQLAALYAQQLAQATADAVDRSTDPTIPGGAAAIAAAHLDLQNKTNALATARQALAAARQALATAISTWQGGAAPQNTAAAQADVARLATRNPIVFFPVRLETRFDRSVSPAVLKVRIYPDEIFLDSHETLLTPAEVEAAAEYFAEVDAAADPNDTASEVVPWAKIVQKMSPERASYVLRVGRGATAGATDVWTKAGEAVLPDYWVIVTYRNGVPTPHFTNLIPDPLPLTVDPTHTVADQVVVPGSNGLQKIDAGILWTVHFDTAEALGMAKTIQLSAAEAADGTGGFDRIVVFGIKSSMPEDVTATHLEKLFDAHHYTRGFAVVPQGSPTNNTEARPTPYPRTDEGGTRVLFEERGDIDDLVTPDEALVSHRGTANLGSATFTDLLGVSDVKALAAMLGVPDGVIPNIQKGDPDLDDFTPDFGGHEQARAAAMNRALWPSLIGYAIQHLVRGPFPALDHDGARSYFTSWVRARGPAPAFRLGDVPYGVLPVLSTANWAVRGGSAPEQLENKLLPSLKLLRSLWLRASAGVTRVGPGSADPFGDLLKVLALHPSAREVRLRSVVGPAALFNLCQFAGLDYQTTANAIIKAVAGTFAAIGQPAWKTSALAESVHDTRARRILTDAVDPALSLSEDTGLPSARNYLVSLTIGDHNTPNIAGLLQETATFGGAETTLLYRLVRHSVLLEVARGAALFVGSAVFPRIPDLEVIGMSNAAVPTYAQLLASPAPNGVGTLGDYIFKNNTTDLYNALLTLSGTPTAELDRLVTETIDLGSNRLDAWLTALATRRLIEIRNAQPSSELPVGSYLGGYGFVENVRPVTPVVQNRPGVGTVEIQPTSGGFIEAPSLAHATAAAILRGGSLAYRAEDPQKYAIDLSSARVRGARQILDELRAGQPLGSVLGQHFEQRLKDGYPPALGLDAYRNALRKRYPLVVGKSVPLVAGESFDGAAARNVVDGLALSTAFAANAIPFGSPSAPDLPPPTPLTVASAYTAIVTELGALRDSVDGVSDLVVSEAVLQISRGNTNTTLGNLDALARGGRPPESQLARSARTGIGLTQRVALVFPDGAAQPSTGWATGPAGPTPRAAAEPTLDGWLAGVLGDPTKVACTVHLVDGANTASTKQVTLASLGYVPSAGAQLQPLRPREVLSLGRALNAPNQGSVLDRWISVAALRNTTGLAVTSIDYAAPAGLRSFPEVLEVAATAADLLAGARPLTGRDLTAPAEASAVDPSAGSDAGDLLTRATSAISALQQARDPLAAAMTSADLRAGLEGVSGFIFTALPAPGTLDSDLDAIRIDVLAEVNRRIQAASAVPPPLPGATLATIDAATQILSALFDEEFVALSSFSVPQASEVSNSFAARSTLVGTNAPDPINQVLQSAAQVQPGLGRWRQLNLYLGVTGRPRPRQDVAQLPHVPGETWVALPGPTPERGRVGVVVMSGGTGAPDVNVAWRGLMIDEWVEQIPNQTEEAGLTFNFDHPLSEAAQTVLVAVPSRTGSTWAYDDVLATINETLDLAKIRSVDRELLDIGQVIPTLYLAQDAKHNTVSTNWAGLVGPATTG
jgi:hypothetical protein